VDVGQDNVSNAIIMFEKFSPRRILKKKEKIENEKQ
jgi:hypothetical protein